MNRIWLITGVMLVFVLALPLMNTRVRAQDYPEAGITNLRKTCGKRRDIPSPAMAGYCDCYVELMQRTVPWRDFLSLDSAVAAKGIAGVDAEESAILHKGLQVTRFCAQRATRGTDRSPHLMTEHLRPTPPP